MCFVLKLVEMKEKDRFILADRFFTSLGYSTPCSKCLTESLSIRSKLIPLVEENIKQFSSESKEIQFHQMELFKFQLNLRNMLLIMKHMPGTSIEDIHENQLLPLLKNRLFLQSIGEMIFIDAFIGNTDRITSQVCNLGNDVRQ